MRNWTSPAHRLATLILLAAPLLAASCGTDPAIGERYRAERELSRLGWSFRNLSLRPQDTTDEQWADLAARYEALADRFNQPGAIQEGEIGEEIQTIAARALFTAARVHGNLRDSIHVHAIHERMAGEFAHLPQVFAEVELARGKIAHTDGRIDEAIVHYGNVVENAAPEVGAAGAAGVVLDLPLLMTRLHNREHPDEDPSPPYDRAATYYERVAQEHSGELLGMEAQARLSEVAADRGDWDRALGLMADIEAELVSLDDPPRDPSAVRLAIAGMQNRAQMDLSTIAATLASLLTDYPESEHAPQALLNLADIAVERGRIEDALGYFEEITERYGDHQAHASEAMLRQGQLLESEDRWSEALRLYRALPNEYPVTEAALWAPLRIAQHYMREGETEEGRRALDQAERAYRDFIEGTPPGRLTVFAKERLIETMLGQEKYDEAITESIALGDQLVGTRDGVSHLIAAASIARGALADTSRAADILDHLAETYPQTGVGQWAATEAESLRGTASR